MTSARKSDLLKFNISLLAELAFVQLFLSTFNLLSFVPIWGRTLIRTLEHAMGKER